MKFYHPTPPASCFIRDVDVDGTVFTVAGTADEDGVYIDLVQFDGKWWFIDALLSTDVNRIIQDKVNP